MADSPAKTAAANPLGPNGVTIYNANGKDDSGRQRRTDRHYFDASGNRVDLPSLTLIDEAWVPDSGGG